MLSNRGRKVLVMTGAAVAVLSAACTQVVVETGTPSAAVSPTATSASIDSTSTALPAISEPSPTTAETATATPAGNAPSQVASPTPLPTAAPIAPTDGSQEPTPGNFAHFLGGQLVAQDETMLGDLVPASQSFGSICNPAGEYGSQFSLTSIFNPDTPYGGPFGAQSPFNPDATQPPAIAMGGETVAYLTVSTFVADAVHPNELLAYLGCQQTAE